MFRFQLIILLFLSQLWFSQVYGISSLENKVIPSDDGDVNKITADQYYMKGDYESAKSLYTYIVKNQGISSELYYNLANCYYQLDSIPKAILYFEKALKLDPSDVDIRSNLSLARSKISDVGTESEDFILLSWWRTFSNSLSLTKWRLLGYIVFLFLLSLLTYLYVFKKEKYKIVIKPIAILLVFVFIVIQLAAWQQFHSSKYSKNAIVMAEELEVRSSPDTTSSTLFIIHSGARLTILDDELSDWCEIRFENGKEGWIEKRFIEMI